MQATAECGSNELPAAYQLTDASLLEGAPAGKTGILFCHQQQRIIPDTVQYNDMFMTCNTALQSLPRIWLAQQLAVSLVFTDIKSFFDSLALSLATGLIQSEVFLQDCNGEPTFDLKQANLKKGPSLI